MDIQIIQCRTCREKMQYLGHELTVIPIVKEMAPIGQTAKSKVCNVSFYCGNCQCNMSKAFPYEDEKFIPMFIKDVKKHSVTFENHDFVEVI